MPYGLTILAFFTIAHTFRALSPAYTSLCRTGALFIQFHLFTLRNETILTLGPLSLGVLTRTLQKETIVTLSLDFHYYTHYRRRPRSLPRPSQAHTRGSGAGEGTRQGRD